MNRVTLVLGGARSGKSRYAESLAAPFPSRAYVATAQGNDDEMLRRIGHHQERRGLDWNTKEAPLDLASALETTGEDFILIDCITLWISNLLLAQREIVPEVETLCSMLNRHKSRIVIVSNEVGQGIVPDNALARRFRDEQGLANQRLAQTAHEVVLVVAGLPLVLKSGSLPPAPPGTAG